MRAFPGVAAAAAALILGACGGSGDSGTTTPLEKTCAQDPTQAKCITPPTTTLRGLASAKGRSFGVSVDAAFFGASPAAYDAVVAREFNLIVAGNVMKWSSIHRDSRYSYRWTNPDSMVAFAQANGMKVRGHTLVWYQQNPAWLTGATWDPDTLKVVLKEHIDSVVGHYKGKILAWDVVNEAFNDGTGSLRVTGSPWATTLGAGYIDLAFQEARAADPAALLFYNDYNLETPGLKQDSVFARLSGMKSRGVPIDGIGFQAHFQVNADATGVPSKETLIATFNRFAALGLKIHITELDIRVRTPGATSAELTAQSQGFTNITAACLAVAACEAMIVWGLNDGESWVNSTFPGYGQALLFDDSYGKKATYNAVTASLQAP
ncbi:MAG TPA: endo-1,4-beta-xylanase [Gemmatimonadaceae bacterium]|nr:endo-1,4-beta-xylanase [Gemmatimonadaceae bacterium]